MNLSKVDIELLKRTMEQAHILLILMTNDYIEGMKDPKDEYHLGLNVQIQQAAKGEQDVYLLCIRPIEKDNFSLVMDMLEGSKLKCIIFIDPDDDEDREMATRIIHHLTGGNIKVTGTSGDAVIEEGH